jgi:hypothetical protein
MIALDADGGKEQQIDIWNLRYVFGTNSILMSFYVKLGQTGAEPLFADVAVEPPTPVTVPGGQESPLSGAVELRGAPVSVRGVRSENR